MNKEPEMRGMEVPSTCDACGTQALVSSREQQRFLYGKEGEQEELAAEVTVWRCKECGFEFTAGDAEDARHEAVCRYLGVLSPREIRELRARRQLSQSKLAEITGLGEASIKRWELGLNTQNQAADRLLRLLEAPGNLDRLLQMSLSRSSSKSSSAPKSKFRTQLPQSAYLSAAVFELRP